jgi:hypothetical protein
MGGTALEEVHHLFDAKMSRQVSQGVNVVGIDIVDLHINSLFNCVLLKVIGQPGSGGSLQERPTLHGGPGEMQPYPRVGM